MINKTIAVVNATGRQAASVVRVAAAVGDQVRAHVNSTDGLVAQELAALPNVMILEGSLEDEQLVAHLFAGAQRAFVNTTPFGDEVAIGRSLANAAKKAGVRHYIYSSMPDHSIYGHGWPALPLWSVKFTVENYVRQVGSQIDAVYALAGKTTKIICRLVFMQPLFMLASTIITLPAFPIHCSA